MSSKLESDVCCRFHLVKATKVNAGLAESNGRLLLPGIWRDSLHVTCGLTACTPGSAPGPTLGNEYGKTLPFTYTRARFFSPSLRARSTCTFIATPSSSLVVVGVVCLDSFTAHGSYAAAAAAATDCSGARVVLRPSRLMKQGNNSASDGGRRLAVQ